MSNFSYNKLKNEFTNKIVGIYQYVHPRDSEFNYHSQISKVKIVWGWIKKLVNHKLKHECECDHEEIAAHALKNSKYRVFCKDMMSMLNIPSFDSFQNYIHSILKNQLSGGSKKMKKLLNFSPKYEDR